MCEKCKSDLAVKNSVRPRNGALMAEGHPWDRIPAIH